MIDIRDPSTVKPRSFMGHMHIGKLMEWSNRRKRHIANTIQHVNVTLLHSSLVDLPTVTIVYEYRSPFGTLVDSPGGGVKIRLVRPFKTIARQVGATVITLEFGPWRQFL